MKIQDSGLKLYLKLFPEKVINKFLSGEKIKERELNEYLEKVFISLKSFLPSNLVENKLALYSKKIEKISGSFFFADIAGFTPLSERLSKIGRKGAEEVTRIVSNFFGPLLEIIFKWDGILYRFGGDALLAFFPENNVPFELRSAFAAKECLAFVQERGNIRIPEAGQFKIGMHIALIKGKTFFYDLENEFTLVGKVCNKAIRVGSIAKKGEILVTKNMQETLKTFATLKEKKDRIYKLIDIKEKHYPYLPSKAGQTPDSQPRALENLLQSIKAVKPYFPSWLFEKITLKPYFDPKDGEHRKLTIIFLNFSGISYDKNPAKGYEKIKKFYTKVREITEKYGGYINKIDIDKEGNRILILLGYPYAMEDDERRACLFVDELFKSQDIRKLNIKIRAGIHSGNVYAGPVGSEIRREWTVMGDNVNISARLASCAKNNEVLVSEPVQNKNVTFFDFKKLKPIRLKGKKKLLTLYRLKSKKIVERLKIKKWLSESTIMVGRDEEMRNIDKIVGKVLNKKGQIVGITGEAGMGKSRLVREIVNLLQKKNFKILIGGCESFGSSFSYHPWVDVLTEIFGILPMDSLKQRENKIKTYMTKVSAKMKEWFPIIGEIMGVPFPETSLTKFLDAKLRKQRVFDLTFDFIKYEMKKNPVCVILEDLHWSDTASMELVNYIGRNIGDKPILLIFVFRPLKKKEEFMEKPFYREFLLKELSSNNTILLVENLLSIKKLPEEFKKLIISKSQGNPFYVEEIVKSLIERGFIKEEKGKWKFKGDLKKITLPDTVEGVILSRIDSLDWTTKEVMQFASVLGRDFDEFLIMGIYPNKEILGDSLKNLSLLDLIRIEKAKGQVKYFFKHVLTQEVAYGTLSFAKRKEIHETTGKFIEENLKDRKEEFLGLLSHHYYYAENYDKSLLYSVEAGERAKKVYANYSAIEFFTRAIESYEKMEKEGVIVKEK